MFDFEEYEKSLYRECKSVIPKILDDLSSERIYTISLYNSGDYWEYIFPTVSTLEGLEKVVKEYRQKHNEFYSSLTDDQLKLQLKWSPCDSPHHQDYVDTLKDTEQLLSPLACLFDDLYKEENGESKCVDIHESLVDSTLSVLNRLIKEGTFGKESILVNLINGDQSNEERLARAGCLNTKQLVKEFEEEIAI